MTTLPDGAWPVMLLPLLDDSSIDWATLDGYTDWLIDKGSAGLFPVALSGEMYSLSGQERCSVARRVVERSAGRVPVIASVVASGPADVQARAAARLAATGVDAVVLIVSMLLEDGADDSELIGTVQHILDANPGVDFGIYECPLPYHRLLPTETVKWLAETGRFVFFKETSHDVALMADRVVVSNGTPMKVYNAGIESLVESLAVGVSGLAGWVVNVYPDRVAWLCRNAPHIDHAVAMDEQAALVRVERAMASTYPNSAKHLVAERAGLPMRTVSRWNSTPINPTSLAETAAECERHQPGK
jgi:4-hydroxy-tetrahydrodipicolinate synthase